MNTCSSSNGLVSPLSNPDRIIRHNHRVDPSSLGNFEEINMAGNGEQVGPPPVVPQVPAPDLRTMEELCQPYLNGREPNESSFEAWERYKLSIDRCPNHNMLPVTQIDTFYNGLTMRHRDTINATADGTFIKRQPKDCYDLIENMTAHHNDWDTLSQRIKALTPSCETCGGPHAYNDCPITVGQAQNVYAAGAYNHGGNSYQPQGITTRSGVAYKGPMISSTSTSPEVVERETEVTKDKVPLTSNGSTKDVQPLVVQSETQVPNSKPVGAPVFEPVEAPVSAPKPKPKPSIPYPSRLHDQKLREKANNQIEKIFQIFQDLHFDISFADALILMPKFASTIKSLLTNKKKLFELANFSGPPQEVTRKT
ncbi:hypothetical protein Tco_1500382 [Tanacetum coccineum]